MIRRSRLMLVYCAGAALALHGTGLWVSDTPARIEVAGGAGAMEATLGSSFDDMVTGAAQPVSESTVTSNRQAATVVNPVDSRKAPRPDTPRTAEAARPDDSAARTPREVAETPPVPRAEIAAVPSVETATPTRRPVETPAAPPTATESARAAPLEVIGSQPEMEEGVQVSRRPQARPREVEETAARPSPERERRETRNRSREGNTATRDATRGSAAGTEAATLTQQGRDTARRSAEQGNATASNYPGEVMRHLARVPRPHAEARGVVMVRFSIAQGGRLASVGVAQSSGSTRLDRAALTVVQRAAPFPAPPNGAQTSFFVKIEGR